MTNGAGAGTWDLGGTGSNADHHASWWLGDHGRTVGAFLGTGSQFTQASACRSEMEVVSLRSRHEVKSVYVPA